MYWIHPDHLGGASVLVNSGGKVTNWYEYMPYGEVLMELSNQDYNNPYKYSGKEFDEATGYYYYGARYYDPKRSFWISVDPLAEITQSPYTYVWNNPVNYIDPTGMMGEKPGGKGGPDPNKIYDGGSIQEVIITRKRPNWLSRMRTRSTNWVQTNVREPLSGSIDRNIRNPILKNVREPLSGWFDSHTRNSFVLDAGGQARMNDLRGQMANYMQTNVGGGIRWGAEHGLVGSGMGTGHVGAFSKLDEMYVGTPYGKAFQSLIKSAISARKKVMAGAKLYRIGTLGRSQAAEAQFWSFENPLSDIAAYAKKYGIPIENIKNADFIEVGTLKKGTHFITRPAPAAPGSPAGSGGGIEVVTPANGVKLDIFSTLKH